MDIDAEVQSPIIAGVKGLKVSIVRFQMSALTSSASFPCQVKPLLVLPAQRYAEGHSGAPYWSSATCRRSHHIFHSTPSEYQDKILVKSFLQLGEDYYCPTKAKCSTCSIFCFSLSGLSIKLF